jgi:hypothetical protein
MTLADWLLRFGLTVSADDLPDIRAALTVETNKERESQGRGDTELMKLCCVQLFGYGDVEDALLIWRAKSASMDASCAVDVQLLCGAGLDATKAFLAGHGSPDAERARARILDCEECGDFDEFSVERRMRDYEAYYAD